MDPRTEHVVRLMETQLARAISIEQLAAAVNLSPSRLAHLFRRDLGCSLGERPTEYVLTA
jgi:AraC family transcriptional regulator of arabinose operon